MFGEPLIAVATFAVEAAGLDPLDHHAAWEAVQASGLPVVVHDPLCPLTPVGFIAEAVEMSLAEDCAVVGVRVVTDTVRMPADDGGFGETLDRDRLRQLASPLVIPARVVELMEQRPPSDFAAAFDVVAALCEVRQLEAPSVARRIASVEDLAVLEAYAELNRV